MQAIQELGKLAPATALLVTMDAGGGVLNEREVAIALVQRGDILKVFRPLKISMLTDSYQYESGYTSISSRAKLGCRPDAGERVASFVALLPSRNFKIQGVGTLQTLHPEWSVIVSQ